MLPVYIFVFFAVSVSGKDLCYISDDGKPNYCDEGVCAGKTCLGVGELVGFGLAGLTVLILLCLVIRCVCVKCMDSQRTEQTRVKPIRQHRQDNLHALPRYLAPSQRRSVEHPSRGGWGIVDPQMAEQTRVKSTRQQPPQNYPPALPPYLPPPPPQSQHSSVEHPSRGGWGVVRGGQPL